MPVGGPNGGPLQVQLDQSTLDQLSTDLFRRARLPLDQACWTAGVDLNELQMTYKEKKEEMTRKGVAQWKQEMVGAAFGTPGSYLRAVGACFIKLHQIEPRGFAVLSLQLSIAQNK